MPLSEKFIQSELDKRRPGVSRVVSARREQDKVEILSGLFKGKTTGAPICMIVRNEDIDSAPYELLASRPRPGHADYPAHIRYGGFNDYRGGGRFSGRITVPFVMIGAVAKGLLARMGVEVLAHAIQIGRIRTVSQPTIAQIRRNVYRNPVRCADSRVAKIMEREILEVASQGDSVGGVVEGLALKVQAGIGDPLLDSLDADIAKLMFDIPAVKGVEFGRGFGVVNLRGSECNDPYAIHGGKVVTETNNSGGILGGLSTGMPIVVRVAFKPTPSIRKRQKTVDLERMEEVDLELAGRHDPCIVPRAVPVVESALSAVLVDHLLRCQAIPRVLR